MTIAPDFAWEQHPDIRMPRANYMACAHVGHAVYRQRQQMAREVLPGGSDGHAGWRAGHVNLVGSSPNDMGVPWR